MRSSSKTPTSRIAATGTKPGGGVGTGTARSFGVATSSSIGTPGCRLPPTPSPAPPKFQPFRKPSGTSGAGTASEAEQSAPSATPLTPHKSPVGDLGQDAQAAAAPEQTTEQAMSRTAASVASADPTALESSGESPDPNAAKGLGAGAGKHPNAVQASEADNPAAAAAAAAAAAKTDGQVAPASRSVDGAALQQGLPSEQRLEALLRKAGLGGGKAEDLKVLAAAIVDACRADATAASPAAAGRGGRTRGGVGFAAVVLYGCTATLLALLAACMSWVVWVLMDRRVIGTPVLSSRGCFV